MLTIRSARPADATAITRVHQEAVFSKAATHYPKAKLEEWSHGSTPERIAHVEQEISDPAFVVLIAEAKSELIGFAMALPAKGELRAVYVKPNSIGRVGQTLLAELEERAFKTAEFLTCDSSLNAAEFYKLNGYMDEGRADHVLPSGETIACVHMKKLRPSPS